MPLGTGETLHRWDLVDARTDGLKLSLKLYHARELQLDYQQSIAEAPRHADIATTLGIYTQEIPESVRKTVEELDEKLFGKRQVEVVAAWSNTEKSRSF